MTFQTPARETRVPCSSDTNRNLTPGRRVTHTAPCASLHTRSCRRRNAATRYSAPRHAGLLSSNRLLVQYCRVRLLILVGTLSRFRVVVQRNANRATVVAVVLSYNLLAVKLPEACVMIATCGDQVGRICREGTIPDPTLMSLECSFQRVRLRFGWARGVLWIVFIRRRVGQGSREGSTIEHAM